MWSLSKNSTFVILRLDRGIQKVLKTLDSRLRENDDFMWEWEFLDKLHIPILFIPPNFPSQYYSLFSLLFKKNAA